MNNQTATPDPRDDTHAAKTVPAVSLSVIFPAFNEEANIQRTVESARLILPKLAKTYEIILVNDGSKDATTPLCDELAARYPEVRAIHHVDNRGYGAALKSGILAARHDFIFFTDSDGQFDLEELKDLIKWAGQFDIVTGYRGKRQDPPHRLINAFGWKMLVRMVLGVKVRDIDCAFKIFQRSVFDRVQIRSVGAMVNTEILAQANAFGMSIHEVRVSHYPRQFGKPSGANLRVILKAFRELSRLYRQLRTVTNEQEGLYRTDRQIRHKVFRHHDASEKMAADVGAVSSRSGVEPAHESRSARGCYVD